MLTAPEATTASLWQLPDWFYPRDGEIPLTYHSDPARWRRASGGMRLRAVTRGQEFILDTEQFPEAIDWVGSLWKSEGISR